MTMPIRFDTLKYAKRLEVAGIAPSHAEAYAHALSDALINTVVAPGDLILLKADVTYCIETVKQELTDSIEQALQKLIASLELSRQKLALGSELDRQELATSIQLFSQETRAKFEFARQKLNAL